MDWIAVVRNWRWDLIGSVAAALAGGIWSVYTFALERREDRKWKQVEFLLEANQRFFDKAEIRHCIRMLDDSCQEKGLEQVFLSDRATLKPEDMNLLEEFRALFQFFDNLAQCVRMDVLTVEQISLFGWYLQRIYHLSFLKDYCEANGFGDVIDLAEKVERHAYAVK